MTRGQQIGNYINNGSFEEYYDCNNFPYLSKAKYWLPIDSVSYGGQLMNTCYSTVPLNANTYQFPKTGNSYILATTYLLPSVRSYMKNRLKQNLVAGETYCVKFYVNIANTSPRGHDGFAAYFGNSTIDTITQCAIPLTYLIPQIKNPLGNVITDSLNWVTVTGTFVANGTEKYAVIGNFLSDLSLSTASINTPYYPQNWTDVCYDDFSCIPTNLVAYAGPDQSCIPGDSVFIGRQPDFATDSGCIWYKLPNMVTSIDTVSGLWVKPVMTTTYIVRQQLECSALKWDTVVIFQGFVGLKQLKWYADNITLFPNPSTDHLNISFPKATDKDIEKIIIINNLGQIIREVNLEIKNSTTVIESADFANGVYQIHFKTKAGTVTKQFVKLN